MTLNTTPQSTRFKVGWIALLILSSLSVLNHLSLIFFIPDEAVLFIGWTALNLYSTLTFFFPFRRGERWAWFASWILVVVYASMLAFDPQIGIMYAVIAGLMALALVITAPAFFGAQQG